MMKLRLPRRRIWRAAIYLGSFALILIAFDLVLVQTRRSITPGFETTRIVSPVLADGSIDYLTAFENEFNRGVTRENNAFPIMVQALGRNALPPNQPSDGITDRLGMSHVPESGDYFVEFDDYRKNHPADKNDDPLDATTISPGLAQWVKDNAKPLAIMNEASRRPRYFIPFNGGVRQPMVSILLPHLRVLRDVGSAFRLRAIMHLNDGDFAGFREDVMTLHRLTRLLGQSATAVERLHAMVIENDASRTIRLAAASGKLSLDQLRSMQQEMEGLPALPSTADCIDSGERFMLLELLQDMSRAGPAQAGDFITRISGGHGPLFDVGFRFIPVPYGQAMTDMNRFYDGFLAALRQPTYQSREESLKLWNDQFRRVQQRNRISLFLSGEWPALMFMSALQNIVHREEVVRAETTLTQVALALAMFKIEHGAYPMSLDELAPADLKVIPEDLFSGRPLIYARTENGYSLHSVGPNMIDDGGSDKKPADDVVANLP